MVTVVERKRFEYERKKGYIRVKSNISPTNLNFHDSISGSSHSNVIEYHDQTLYSVAYDVEKGKEDKYRARGVIICKPVDTVEEFKAIFSENIVKVKLNIESAKDLLKNTLVLIDRTKISKDLTIEFEESKSYQDTDRFVYIIRRFLEFIEPSNTDLESVIFQTEDSRDIVHIYPKPIFQKVNVPHQDEVYRLLAPDSRSEDEDGRILQALGVWMHFFLENPKHAFLESMERVMRPYEHKAKDEIISDRVDFLVGMIKIVRPDLSVYENGFEKSAGRILKDLFKSPTRATWFEYRNRDNIIERCKNVRNLVIHKIQDSEAETQVSQEDYDIFSTFFYKSFAHLMLLFMESSAEDSISNHA